MRNLMYHLIECLMQPIAVQTERSLHTVTGRHPASGHKHLVKLSLFSQSLLPSMQENRNWKFCVCIANFATTKVKFYFMRMMMVLQYVRRAMGAHISSAHSQLAKSQPFRAPPPC